MWETSSDYSTQLDGGLTKLTSNIVEILEQSTNSGGQESTFVFEGNLPTGVKIGFKVPETGTYFYLLGNGTINPNVTDSNGNSAYLVTDYLGWGYFLNSSSGTNTVTIKRNAGGAIYVKFNDRSMNPGFGNMYGTIKTIVEIPNSSFVITSTTRKSVVG